MSVIMNYYERLLIMESDFNKEELAWKEKDDEK